MITAYTLTTLTCLIPTPHHLIPIPHVPFQDMLQYRKKLRPLRVRTLDSSIKTLLVDDSQTVVELTRTVCARIGGCGLWGGCGPAWFRTWLK